MWVSMIANMNTFCLQANTLLKSCTIFLSAGKYSVEILRKYLSAGKFSFEILRKYLSLGKHSFEILRKYLSAGKYSFEILRKYLSVGKHSFEILRKYLSAGKYSFEILRKYLSAGKHSFGILCNHLPFHQIFLSGTRGGENCPAFNLKQPVDLTSFGQSPFWSISQLKFTFSILSEYTGICSLTSECEVSSIQWVGTPIHCKNTGLKKHSGLGPFYLWKISK